MRRVYLLSDVWFAFDDDYPAFNNDEDDALLQGVDRMKWDEMGWDFFYIGKK